MNIVTYIHPTRTYLPCTGVGRHINNLVLGLNALDDIDLKLLFSQQWLSANGRLDDRSPLSSLPFITFPTPENPTERNWKLFGWPRIDRYIPDDSDWIYAPVDSYLPTSKCPIAITIHDIQAFETDLPWSRTWQHKLSAYKWARWVPKALKEFRVIFTVSEFSKQRMVDLLAADPQKIVVSGNGVDRSFFDIQTVDPNTIESPIAEPYTMIIGGLREKKGADYILAVAKALQQQRSNLQIVVAGELESKYAGVVKEFSNIKLLGMVADRDLPRLLRRASSLLFLSLYEGFGIPALEAMAAGIPVIAANRGSLPEIVGMAGKIVEPEQTAQIVDILHQLQDNSQLRANFIDKGRDRAAEYTWSRCVDNVYRTLCERI